MKRPQRSEKVKSKNALARADAWPPDELRRMARTALYDSSDHHKAAPDSDGVPKHRPDKTVCLARGGRRPNARQLLRLGFRRGMVSVQRASGWPRNVWAVDADGIAYEGSLTNRGTGQYHGYPMRAGSPFTKHVLEQWDARHDAARSS